MSELMSQLAEYERGYQRRDAAKARRASNAEAKKAVVEKAVSPGEWKPGAAYKAATVSGKAIDPSSPHGKLAAIKSELMGMHPRKADNERFGNEVKAHLAGKKMDHEAAAKHHEAWQKYDNGRLDAWKKWEAAPKPEERTRAIEGFTRRSELHGQAAALHKELAAGKPAEPAAAAPAWTEKKYTDEKGAPNDAAKKEWSDTHAALAGAKNDLHAEMGGGRAGVQGELRADAILHGDKAKAGFDKTYAGNPLTHAQIARGQAKQAVDYQKFATNLRSVGMHGQAAKADAAANLHGKLADLHGTIAEEKQPGALQVGAKGGQFYMTKSGLKIYVKK